MRRVAVKAFPVLTACECLQLLLFLLFHKLFHNEKHSNKDLLPSHSNKALLPSHDEDEDVNAYLQEILEAMDDDMMEDMVDDDDVNIQTEPILSRTTKFLNSQPYIHTL